MAQCKHVAEGSGQGEISEVPRVHNLRGAHSRGHASTHQWYTIKTKEYIYFCMSALLTSLQ